MGFDQTSAAAHSDAKNVVVDHGAAAGAAGDAGGSLQKLQQSGGVFGKGSEFNDKKIMPFHLHQGESGSMPGDAHAPGSSGGGHESFFNGHTSDSTSPPTTEERAEADKSLDKNLSKMASPENIKTMQAIDAAITSGDKNALGEALKNADPKRLDDMLGEVNRVLEAKGSLARLDRTEDGHVLLSDGSSKTALSYDINSGKCSARAVDHNSDGSLLVKPGEVLHSDLDKTFSDISDRAVNSINGKIDMRPFFKDMPTLEFPKNHLDRSKINEFKNNAI